MASFANVAKTLAIDSSILGKRSLKKLRCKFSLKASMEMNVTATNRFLPKIRILTLLPFRYLMKAQYKDHAISQTSFGDEPYKPKTTTFALILRNLKKWTKCKLNCYLISDCNTTVYSHAEFTFILFRLKWPDIQVLTTDWAYGRRKKLMLIFQVFPTLESSFCN